MTHRSVVRDIGVPALLLLLAGCAPKVLVPPRIDLKSYGTIGVYSMTTNAQGGLGTYATGHLIEVLQEAQPGTPVLELGAFGGNTDPASLTDIGTRHKVDAVFVGDLDVSKVRPRMDLSLILTSMNVQALVEANMRLKLYDTRTGAVLWTRSGYANQEVGHVSFSKTSGASFDAREPDKAYGSLVRSLVNQVTGDFWSHWERGR